MSVLIVKNYKFYETVTKRKNSSFNEKQIICAVITTLNSYKK